MIVVDPAMLLDPHRAAPVAVAILLFAIRYSFLPWLRALQERKRSREPQS